MVAGRTAEGAEVQPRSAGADFIASFHVVGANGFHEQMQLEGVRRDLLDAREHRRAPGGTTPVAVRRVKVFVVRTDQVWPEMNVQAE